MGTEGGFPLVTFLNTDKMVSMPEINFGEELRPVRTVKEVRDVGEWVMVFLHDFVEVPKINTKPKGTSYGTDETVSKMLINKLTESPEFVWRRRVDWTKWKSGSLLSGRTLHGVGPENRS